MAYSLKPWAEVAIWKSTVIRNQPNQFQADLFVVKNGYENYIFAEDYNYKNQKAVISVLSISENHHKYLGTALEEDFHLSYPFIL